VTRTPTWYRRVRACNGAKGVQQGSPERLRIPDRRGDQGETASSGSRWQKSPPMKVCERGGFSLSPSSRFSRFGFTS